MCDCSKGDFDSAIAQYIRTIGKLEPSYVIRKVSSCVHSFLAAYSKLCVANLLAVLGCTEDSQLDCLPHSKCTDDVMLCEIDLSLSPSPRLPRQCLHERGEANADHTTLLLNCYTKLKAIDELNKFVAVSVVDTHASNDLNQPHTSFLRKLTALHIQLFQCVACVIV